MRKKKKHPSLEEQDNLIMQRSGQDITEKEKVREKTELELD